MARPCLDRNPKFQLLIRRLGLPKPYVRGHLEQIWDCANECGNPRFANCDQLEAAAEWQGKPGMLGSELSKDGSNFVDLDPETGEYEIHDFWDHAPEYVTKRRVREQDRNAKGFSLRELRIEAGRKGGHTKASKRLANAGNLLENPSKRLANGVTPAPAPAPNYTEKRSAHPSAERSSIDSDHQEFYQAYRRKKNPSDSLKAYKSVRKSGISHDVIMRGLAEYQAESEKWPIDRIKYPASWLRAGGFASEPDQEEFEELSEDAQDTLRRLEAIEANEARGGS